MVKQKARSVKDEIKKQEEEYGDVQDEFEQEDDVDEMYADAFGHEPKRGENIADEVREAEETRRGKKAHFTKKSR